MKTLQDFPISELTNYKIGGKARYVLECENKEDVLQALDFIDKNNILQIFVMGLGTNLLFNDEKFDGVIIKIVRSQNNLISLTSDGYVSSFAGELVDNLIQFAFANDLIGLEWAGGLPGTVGGGVRGNAGAFGGEMKDTFYEAEVLLLHEKGFDIKNYTHKDMEFSYRHSAIKNNKKQILLSCTFILSKTDSKQVAKAKEKYMSCIAYRKEQHPLNYPNCGSVFKNIAKSEDIQKILAKFPDLQEKVDTVWRGKIAMGYMTKLLGFEKYKVGGAMISEKHGNYIVNLGGAKFSDVKKIIEDVQDKFQETFGFTPETEVEIVS